MTTGWGHGPRVMAGVMSGTSVDGIDVALVRLEGTGRTLTWQVIHHVSIPFEAGLRDRILAVSHADVTRVDDLARLHVRLAIAYAEAVAHAETASGVRVDAVGCHGQTVRHLPEPSLFDGAEVRATLQLGDASVLAQRLGVPVVADFRPADMALGGQGAPLVPYADWALLTHPEEHRIALNIGGIANVTFLPAGSRAGQVTAFDTGPGNMVSDALCARLFGEPYDREGRHALAGTVHRGLLDHLLSDPWFARTPPKSTGRETFGPAYASALEARAAAEGLSNEDLIATAAALTAESIAGAVHRFAPFRPARVLVAGGGLHNRAMMDRLRMVLGPASVESTRSAGIDPDAREAIAFAVLAHETLGGVPTSLPAVTGASRSAVLGKICLPG